MRKEKGAIIAAVVLLLDQATKIFSLKVGSGFLNQGFSFGWGSSAPLIVFILLNLLFLIFFLRFSSKPAGMLIFTGGASNLLDRLFRGGVVDFLAFSRWPAFNLADVAIVVGCFWLLIDLLQTKSVS